MVKFWTHLKGLLERCPAEPSAVAVIVKGPPSYLNVEELLYQKFPGDVEPNLFVRIERNNPYRKRERMQAVINTNKWSQIRFIETKSDDFRLRSMLPSMPHRLRSLVMLLMRLYYLQFDRIALNKLAREHGTSTTVVCGHTIVELHLAAKLRPRTCIIVDSGSSIKKWQEAGRLPAVSKHESRLLRLSGIKSVKTNKLSLFTATAVPDLGIETILNTHDLKRMKIKGKEQGDEVVIVGMIPRFLQNLQWWLVVEEMIASTGVSRDNMVYIPHPGGREPVDFLAEVSRVLECRIDDRLLPIEEKLVRAEKRPQAILGFGSTSLKHLAVMFGQDTKVVTAWNDSWAALQPYRINFRREAMLIPNLQEVIVSAVVNTEGHYIPR